MKKLFLFAIVALFANNLMAQQELLLNLKKGETKQQYVEADIQISQEYMGMNMDIGMDMDVAASFNVLDVQQDDITFNVKYDKMEMIMEMMGMEVVMTSEETEESKTNGHNHHGDEEDDHTDTENPANQMFKALTEGSFEMITTNKGELKEVNGFDELFANMFDSIELPEEELEAMKEEMKSSISEDSFSQNFNFDYLPTKAVKVGDSWSKNRTQTASNVDLTSNATYTLKEFTNQYAIIDVDATLDTNEEAEMMTQGMKMAMDMSGTMKGTYKVDVKTGWVIEATINQDVEGVIRMIDQDMEMPMKMISTIKISE